jgi:hypothetical protein
MQLLAGTFNGLSRRGTGPSGFLADSPARTAFARGLVEVCFPPQLFYCIFRTLQFSTNDRVFPLGAL